MDALTLSSLLSSRLCHDLISPVGAAANGVEVCLDDPSSCDMAMPLIADSVKVASARLQFYRLAFGYSGGDAGEYGVGDMERITRGLFDQSKVEVRWASDVVGLPKTHARLILMLAMILGEALIVGGTLDVGVNDGSYTLSVEGERVKMNAQVALVLSGQGQGVEPDPKTVTAFLLMTLAETSNASILIEEDVEQKMVVRVAI